MNTLAPKHLWCTAVAAAVLALAGCTSASAGAKPASTSPPATPGASVSTQASWQSSALPEDATTLWRQPNQISNLSNLDSAAKPGTYTLALECVGTGKLTLSLTAGAAAPATTTADCAASGNVQVTADLQSAGDLVSSVVVSARADGALVWRLSHT